MSYLLDTWLTNALNAIDHNFRWMVWNTFLAVIPLGLSLWLFRLPGRRRLLWWVGVAVFLAFLPNSPYVLTDIIHLVNDIRHSHSIWVITLVLFPVYLLVMAVGFEAYVMSIINVGYYLERQGWKRWILPSELIIHALCAIGIYLGRFNRFNSWDILTQPDELVSSMVNELSNKRPLVIIVVTFGVITGMYWLAKQVSLALAFYWRYRHQNRDRSSRPRPLLHE